MPPTNPHPLLVYRHARAISRASLARAIGCSDRSLYRWEHGLTRPHVVWALRASRIVGVPVERLFDPSASGSVHVPAASYPPGGQAVVLGTSG